MLRLLHAAQALRAAALLTCLPPPSGSQIAGSLSSTRCGRRAIAWREASSAVLLLLAGRQLPRRCMPRRHRQRLVMSPDPKPLGFDRGVTAEGATQLIPPRSFVAFELIKDPDNSPSALGIGQSLRLQPHDFLLGQIIHRH